MKRIQSPWFSFKGVKNTEVGCLMVKQPTIQQAAQNVSKTSVSGMDGFLAISDGTFGPAAVSIEVVVPDRADLDGAMEWLSGSGELVLWDDPAKCWDAYIMTGSKRSPVAPRLEGQKFTVSFTCQPFRREIAPSETVITSTAATLPGKGHVKAFPIVKIEGSGTQSVIINLTTITVNLTAGKPLYIDCQHMLAYSINSDGKREFEGNKVVLDDGLWWEMKPSGSNLITATSGVTRLAITPRWRWF